jgi:hypothetical protein
MFQEPHGVTSQKTTFLVEDSLRNSCLSVKPHQGRVQLGTAFLCVGPSGAFTPFPRHTEPCNYKGTCSTADVGPRLIVSETQHFYPVRLMALRVDGKLIQYLCRVRLFVKVWPLLFTLLKRSCYYMYHAL